MLREGEVSAVMKDEERVAVAERIQVRASNEEGWCKHKKQILAQMKPVQWVKSAAEGARRSLIIRKRFIVHAVGVP